MTEKKPVTIVKVENVAFAYGKNVILDHITFNVVKGDYIGIIGPNGGGKTTLIKIMLGLLVPTHGQVTLFDEPIQKAKKRSEIAYVPQYLANDIRSFPATVREVVMSGSAKPRANVISKALKMAGITELAKRRVGELSGGERQRVLIARALAAEPTVLILDEPTSAIDVAGQEDFYDFLRKLSKQGLTIIIVSHDVDIIAHEVDTVLCLNKHLVCHGPTEQVLTEHALERAYGKNAKILHQH